MHSRLAINVVGCHAEGEVGDVIVGGVLPPAGHTMMERMITTERDHDHIRQLLICEPRGSVARHVNLIGLLKVSLRKVPARKAGTLIRNPATGQMVEAAAKPASVRMKIRALSKLKAAASP